MNAFTVLKKEEFTSICKSNFLCERFPGSDSLWFSKQGAACANSNESCFLFEAWSPLALTNALPKVTAVHIPHRTTNRLMPIPWLHCEKREWEQHSHAILDKTGCGWFGHDMCWRLAWAWQKLNTPCSENLFQIPYSSGRHLAQGEDSRSVWWRLEQEPPSHFTAWAELTQI